MDPTLPSPLSCYSPLIESEAVLQRSTSQLNQVIMMLMMMLVMLLLWVLLALLRLLY